MYKKKDLNKSQDLNRPYLPRATTTDATGLVSFPAGLCPEYKTGKK